MVNTYLMNELRNDIREGAVIPFVGSGLSVGSGLPSWYHLISPLADEIEYPIAPPEWATADSLIEAAQAYINERGLRSFIAYLKNALDSTGVMPTAAHLALAQLPCTLLFTPNYDDLLERVYRTIGKSVRLVIRDNDIPFMSQSADSVNVVKLYGDLNQPETIVLARQQYERFFLDRPQILKLLESELGRKTILYLGFGHRDPHYGLVFGELLNRYGEFMHKGYAVMFGVNQPQRKELERKNIHIIDLGDKGDRSKNIANWLSSLSA